MFTRDQEITTADGETWKILGVGAEEEGETCLHLASTTKGVQQKNGFRPAQIMVWVDHATMDTRRAC